MVWVALFNIILSATVVGGIVAGHAWAILTVPTADADARSAASRDIDSYRQVIMDRRLAHGVA